MQINQENKVGIDLLEIKKVFGNDVDFYIDGGKSKLGIGSTIVQVIDGKPNIIRQGTITEKEIEEVCYGK